MAFFNLFSEWILGYFLNFTQLRICFNLIDILSSQTKEALTGIFFLFLQAYTIVMLNQEIFYRF